jgi:hypothetical protein
MKFHINEKDAVRFGVKVTVKFEFDFESFSTLHIQHVVSHVKIWFNFLFVSYISLI